MLLTTQYLDEADQLADRISVIDAGRVIAEGTPGQLKASVGASALHVRLLNPDDRPRAREALVRALGPDASDVTEDADPAALSATVESSAPAMRAVAALEATDIPVAQFALGQPTLDEVFLALTGHAAVGVEPGDAPSTAPATALGES